MQICIFILVNKNQGKTAINSQIISSVLILQFYGRVLFVQMLFQIRRLKTVPDPFFVRSSDLFFHNLFHCTGIAPVCCQKERIACSDQPICILPDVAVQTVRKGIAISLQFFQKLIVQTLLRCCLFPFHMVLIDIHIFVCKTHDRPNLFYSRLIMFVAI